MHQSLIQSYFVIYAHIEDHVPGSSNTKVISTGETFILHFSKAGRYDLYMGIIFTNLGQRI